jgi:hypothetical protein
MESRGQTFAAPSVSRTFFSAAALNPPTMFERF